MGNINCLKKKKYNNLSFDSIDMSSNKNILIYVGTGVNGKGPKCIEKIMKDFGYNVTLSTTISNLSLNNYVSIIFPGGSAKKQRENLTDDDFIAIKNYVYNGGIYVGICAGAFLQCSYIDGLVPVKIKKDNSKRGYGIVGLKYNETIFNSIYHNGPVFAANKKIETICTYMNDVGYLNNKMIYNPAIIRYKLGKGVFILCGPHPEQTEGLEKFTRAMILNKL